MKVSGPGKVSLGLAYRFADLAQERAAVAIPYGSSEQLMKNLKRRHRRRSVIAAFLTLLQKAIRRGGWHIIVISAKLIRQVAAQLQLAITVAEKK